MWAGGFVWGAKRARRPEAGGPMPLARRKSCFLSNQFERVAPTNKIRCSALLAALAPFVWPGLI